VNLEQIRALIDAATAGPWGVRGLSATSLTLKASLSALSGVEGTLATRPTRNSSQPPARFSLSCSRWQRLPACAATKAHTPHDVGLSLVRSAIAADTHLPTPSPPWSQTND
jgi:hypothetical protein